MARIDLINVSKTLADQGAAFSIQNLSLRVPNGLTLVILGPSGCGKTTLLKLIAGLIPPDSGEVRYDDVDVRELPPGARRVGMVFQNYALYPHFTSRANVLSYFLFRKKTPELSALAREKYQRTSELMGVELEALLDRKPPTLSGGEKQRVALGRCITRDAAIFLVDEPFANLDQALREKYRVNLKALLRQFSITTVYVTHDHNEALILADRLAIMSRGRIEQVGSCEEIYHHPRNLFVAGFLNLHAGMPPLGVLEASDVPGGTSLGNVQLGVRPEDVSVSRVESTPAAGGSVASVLALPMKNTAILTIKVGPHDVYAEASGDERFRPGDPVWLTFRRYHVFDKDTGLRLRSHPADSSWHLAC